MRSKIRILHDKRAITPVLSNLLLTVVAVAAMAVATTATYVVSTNMKETMSERLIVEDLWFNPSTGDIHVYLHNIGKVTIHVAAVYVNHTSQHFTSQNLLEINDHSWFKISYTWTKGSLYYVDVVTTRGTHVGGYFEAP